MDLSLFDTSEKSQEGVLYTVLHPGTGLETDIKIRLAGMDSEHYRNEVKRQSEIRINRLKEQKELSEEEKERLDVQLVVALTLDWEGIQDKGKELKFSKQEATRIYSHIGYRWLFNQINQFVGNRANFLPESPKVLS